MGFSFWVSKKNAKKSNPAPVELGEKGIWGGESFGS
jgi:hypothetical protein